MNEGLDPKVVAVVVNWNGLEDTVKCIESLEKLAYSNLEIVIVDNASKMDEARILREIYGDKVHALRTKENRGYAAGINYAIQYSLRRFKDVKYFLLLNNDIVLDFMYLKDVVRIMEDNPSIGIASGKILLMNKNDKLYSIGCKWSLKTGLVKNLGYGAKNDQDRLETTFVDFVAGCAFVVRHEVIKDVGLMDEKYFLYFDETDYCLRVWRAGYKIALIPAALAFHKSAASTRKISESSIFYFQRSRMRFVIKNIEAKYLTLAVYVNLLMCMTSLINREMLRYSFPKAILYTLRAIYQVINQARRIRSEGMEGTSTTSMQPALSASNQAKSNSYPDRKHVI